MNGDRLLGFFQGQVATLGVMALGYVIVREIETYRERKRARKQASATQLRRQLGFPAPVTVGENVRMQFAEGEGLLGVPDDIVDMIGRILRGQENQEGQGQSWPTGGDGADREREEDWLRDESSSEVEVVAFN